MIKINHIAILRNLLLCLFAFFMHLAVTGQEETVIDNKGNFISVRGQEETVIDNKGNFISVRNNSVTTAATAPLIPLENDIWIDTTTNLTKVYDGATWLDITHIGTTGSVFFAGTDGKPTENNGQLFWNNTTNRLGIGTAAPSNKLQVTGAIRSQGYLNSNGTPTEPSYRFSSDSNTGIYRPAADELGFSVGGIQAVRIDETSNNTTVTINETLELNGQVLDENNATGTAGQVLTATATGTVWSSSASPIKAFGKISSTGAVVKGTTGVTVTQLPGNGRYRVNLPAGTVSDTNYIIQLTQPGRGGAGNDDPGISYNNQTATSFEVIIGDNDNGGTDRARFNSEFMFTVLDL